MSRVIGIDLGTTHTVVAYADLKAPASSPLPPGEGSGAMAAFSPAIHLFPIEQLIAPGAVAAA